MSTNVSELVSRGEYDRAIQLLRDELERGHSTPQKRQELGEVLAQAGRAAEAAELLASVADDYARSGQPGKAIALLKKIQQLDSGRSSASEGGIARLAKERDQQIAQEQWLRHAGMKRGRDATGRPEGPAEPIALDLDMDLDRAPRTERPSAEPTLEFALEGDEPAGADRPEIGASPLFSDFSTEELLAVMRGFRLVSFEPGDILVTEGAPGDSLFVLTTGSVKAFVRDAEGNNHLVRQMTDGAFFGEVSVLTGKARTATVVAAAPCELLELDRETLDGIGASHPHVLEVLKTFSAMRLGSATETEARGAKSG